MIACTFRTKKDLKAAKGTDIRHKLQETSLFGKEYNENMQGVPIVGPGPYERKWYAQIWIEKHILTKVK